jgi:hypothetical protein
VEGRGRLRRSTSRPRGDAHCCAQCCGDQCEEHGEAEPGDEAGVGHAGKTAPADDEAREHPDGQREGRDQQGPPGPQHSGTEHPEEERHPGEQENG